MGIRNFTFAGTTIATVVAIGLFFMHSLNYGIEFKGGPKGTNVVLLSGEPIREPVVFAGPFAMTTEDDIVDAQHRYRRGDMDYLSPSF